MQATRLVFALLFGAILVGLCMAKSPQRALELRHQSREGCGSDEFACNDGWCIPASWQCDGWSQCFGSGGEDEMNCPTKSSNSGCDSDEFACNDGWCIPSSSQCDGWSQCFGSDGEDEANCS